MDLGAILTQHKQYEEAIAVFRRAVELDPTRSDAHYQMGNLYRVVGNTAESQKEFAKVRELRKQAEKAEEDLARKLSPFPPSLPK